MRSNDLSWSPTFPTTILLASEDFNLYTFDIRNLKTPSQIYKGHVAAVMSCDWSPTGTEFVSGSWDRTVRIWKEGTGKSRDVYHTKRMQRLVLYFPLLSTIHSSPQSTLDLTSLTYPQDIRNIIHQRRSIRANRQRRWECPDLEGPCGRETRYH